MMPAYLQWLPPVPGYALIGQRIVWATIFMFVLLLCGNNLVGALQPLADVKKWPGLILGAVLVGVQWGVFVWAPLNGETLGLGLGYVLLPLVLVLIGRFLLNENVSNAQWAATGLAAIAVACNLWNTGAFSWVALVIAFGYPLYFMLRRKQPIPVLSAFFLENLLLLPLAWWACVSYGEVNHPFDYSPFTVLLFSGVGLLGSLGMLSMLSASRRLPVALFGLLGYLEPPLILLVGIFLVGEAIHSKELITYVFILLAMLLLVVDGLVKLRRHRRRHP